MRVLHLVLNVHEGGLERVVGDLARNVDRDEFDTHILAVEMLGRLAAGLGEHAGLHVAKPMSRLSMLRPSSLARDIRRIAPDVLHLHTGVWFKGVRAAKLAGVRRTIYTEHGRTYPDRFLDRVLDAAAARRTNIIVPVSDRLASEMNHFIGSAASRIRVVRNGIDTERFRPTSHDNRLRQELGLARETPVIGTIGRLYPVKGIDIMLEAFSQLHGDDLDTLSPVLVIAGDGIARARLQLQAYHLGIAARVHFLGWREDVNTLHGGFDIYTMSSHSEGTSIGLLEAMSAGCCPVVTDVGGNRDVLGMQLTHRLIPSGDPVALAHAWRAALDDSGRRRRDAEIARSRVLQHFALRHVVEAYEAMYRGDRTLMDTSA